MPKDIFGGRGPGNQKLQTVQNSPGSTTSGSANTSTTLIAANAFRKYIKISNLGVADLWLGFGVAAQSGVGGWVPAGVTETFETTLQINVSSTGTSVPYAWVEFT